MPSGIISRQLERSFRGFGAGVAEVDAAWRVARRDRGELFGQIHHVLVVEVGARHVNQPRCLLLNGFHDAGMAVAGRHHGDSGIEIQKAIAIHVDDHAPLATVHHQRIAARIRG